MTLPDHFWNKVDKTATCWVWTASLNGGYGHVQLVRGHTQRAHRLAYEDLVGPIPPGLTLDHLCRNRACVNPSHLEPVERGENVLRGVGVSAELARSTHCKRGHELTPENVYRPPSKPTQRHCRVCIRMFRAAKHRGLSISDFEATHEPVVDIKPDGTRTSTNHWRTCRQRPGRKA